MTSSASEAAPAPLLFLLPSPLRVFEPFKEADFRVKGGRFSLPDFRGLLTSFKFNIGLNSLRNKRTSGDMWWKVGELVFWIRRHNFQNISNQIVRRRWNTYMFLRETGSCIRQMQVTKIPDEES
jgi:hypothetical protein